MAKAVTDKAKQKKVIKFTKDEIDRINNLRIEVSGVFTQLGQIDLETVKIAKSYDEQVTTLEKAKQSLHEKHAELVEVETVLYKELNGKYGNGNYDPDTGIFTPVEEGVKK